MKNQTENNPARHGGAADRGGADRYYNRGFDPHCFEGATYQSKRISGKDLSPNQLADYTSAYNDGRNFVGVKW